MPRNKKPRRRPVHAPVILQVVEGGPEMWCDHCGLLSIEDFSETWEEALQQAERGRFDAPFMHGHS